MIRGLTVLALALCVLMPMAAEAQDMGKAPMVRKRITWRSDRSELRPSLGWTLNDRYFHNFIVSAGYDYHLLDWLSVGGSAGWAFPIKTGLAKNIEEENSMEGFHFPIPATHLGLLADVHLGFAYGGKAMFWGRQAISYDFHLTAGVGVLQVRWNSEASSRLANEEPAAGMKLSPKIGIGMRVFFDRGFALTLDLVDHMAAMHSAAEVSEDLRVYTFPKEENWLNNIAAMVGFSIMMPYETTHEE